MRCHILAITYLSLFITSVEAIDLGGIVRTSAQTSHLRLGIFLGENTKQLNELISVPIDASSFVVHIPEIRPPDAQLTRVTANSFELAGFLGRINIVGNAHIAQATIKAYEDRDASNSWTPTDLVLETVVTRGRPGGISLFYSDAPFRVVATGNETTISQGWNLVLIDVGRGWLHADSVLDLRVEVFQP